MPDILFFRSTGESNPDASGAAIDTLGPLVAEEWRPSFNSVRPAGLSLLPYAVWWFFDASGVFSNDRYGIFLFRSRGRIVHRSCVFPAYFRFPFMGRGDIQVGDIWTDASERGKGLASAMLRRILATYAGERVWFLCEATNTASANLAKAAGMVLYGTGRREPRLGIGLLGRFVVDSPSGA